MHGQLQVRADRGPLGRGRQGPPRLAALRPHCQVSLAMGRQSGALACVAYAVVAVTAPQCGPRRSWHASDGSIALSHRSCAQLGWAAIGVSDVCGASTLPSAGQEQGQEGKRRCYDAETWDAAEALCSSTGARLCTQGELRADVARGTGCGFDDEMTWTASRWARRFVGETAFRG